MSRIHVNAMPYPLRQILAALLAASLILSGGCAGETLLTAEDYRPSLDRAAHGRYGEALTVFPEGEAGTFITTLERTTLALLDGRPDIDALKDHADLLEDRFRVDISREIASFFYVETPEGYYASEHELVWMHLLLSWGYSMRGMKEEGCVEARRASHLLTAPWSEEGHFDDPTLRTILGTMWALCGSWEDARVDFRVAHDLDPSLAWARTLAEMEAPPRNLFLVLGGIGPEPSWSPELNWNPLRGLRQLRFNPRGNRSPLRLENAPEAEPLHLTPSSLPWYERHLVRDNALHEVIEDSTYTVKATGETALHTTRQAAAIAIWVTATVLTIVGGVVVMYLGLRAESGELFFVGLAFTPTGFIWGKNHYEDEMRESRERLGRETDPSRRYRFARFLPEYAWIGWSDAPAGEQVPMLLSPRPGVNRRHPIQAAGGMWPRVFIGHIPDIGQP